MSIKHPKAPRPPMEGDWVRLMGSGDIGIVEKCMDGGERLWVRIPSTDDWPFPRWAHALSEKVKRIRPPKFTQPEINTEEAPF